MTDYIDKALEIIRATHDGDDLSPSHLKLVELAVNGLLNEAGTLAFEELYQNATKPTGYTVPGFHGIEHLTRDHQGYVRWKGLHVEHYDSPWCYTDQAGVAAQEIARRCRLLESRGEVPSAKKVVCAGPSKENLSGAEFASQPEREKCLTQCVARRTDPKGRMEVPIV